MIPPPIKMNVSFHYHFHPVGQGLFASGCLYTSIRQAGTAEPKFLWVYDCGSVTFRNEARWDGMVSGLKRFARDKRTIDLLTLSHFDSDHINGVPALLRQFEVDTLLLPYATLWDRLEVAFAGDVPLDSPGMSYVIDPLGFLQRQGNIGRIIFVQTSGVGDTVPPAERDVVPLPLSPYKLHVRPQRLGAGDPQAVEFGTAQEMALLPPGDKLTVEALWEFVPYNRPRRQGPPNDTFKAAVNRRRNELLTGPAEERQRALRALKRLYERRLATHAQERNAISLFLYTGPVYRTWDVCKLLQRHRPTMPRYPARLPCYRRVHRWAPGIENKCSLLYTGDGYLDSPPKFEHLRDYLQAERMEKLGVFQVCHHGTLANWHPGLAAKLDPSLSIFCSDPARQRTQHPHQRVWDDFLPYDAVQVNPTGHTSGGWLLKW